VWCLAASAVSNAQVLPATPVTFLGGRLTVGGDVAVAFGPYDEVAFFNYGDYDHDMMRLIRLGAAGTFVVSSRISLHGEFRAEGDVVEAGWTAYPVVATLHVEPFASGRVGVSAGLVQPAFGAFLQRRYGTSNPLIGYPLGYQYTTGVRADALPSSTADLVANRGRGWAPHYPIGGGRGVSGMPLVNTTGWSPGVEVTADTARTRTTVTVMRGSLANPGSSDAHGGWELTGRFEARPIVGLVVGASGAYGSFVDRRLSAVVATAASNRDPRESAFGLDAEYSFGYWIVRAEVLVVRRRFPAFKAPFLDDPLVATSADVEARYKILPGLYAAVRLGYIAFGDVSTASGPLGWDANVGRVEAGLGYALTRNLTAKAVYQYNRRDTTQAAKLGLAAAQLVLTF
jgi:hypothetical protein